MSTPEYKQQVAKQLDQLIKKYESYDENNGQVLIIDNGDTYAEFSQDLHSFIKQALNKQLDEASEVVKDVLYGCDGYEKESDSVRCKWCGQTEHSEEHNKASILSAIKEMRKEI